MEMNKFTCIKPACDTEYESVEEEAYYCPSCVEVNKALAKQIDAQIAARPKRNTHSAVQEMERQKKEAGVKVGGMIGVKV